MSAADALIRATTSALSASFSMTGPLAALMYSVSPSTLSRVPATRCVVGCCADAVETANTAAKATAVMIRIVLMSVLPMGVTRGRAYTDRPEWRRRRREGATLHAISGERILHRPPGNGSAALSTALSESGFGPSRQAAFFGPTVANGALRTRLDLHLAWPSRD